MGLNLNYIQLDADDREDLVRFYTAVLGEPMWRGGEWVMWQVGVGQLVVGPQAEGVAATAGPARVVFGFETDDVSTEFERMIAAGAKVLHAPFHPSDDPDGWLAYVADPGGNAIQLMYPTVSLT